MNVKSTETIYFDVCLEIRQLVKLAFYFSPIEIILPIRHEAFQLFHRNTEGPIVAALKLTRKFGEREALRQLFECFVLDGDSERMH